MRLLLGGSQHRGGAFQPMLTAPPRFFVAKSLQDWMIPPARILASPLLIV
jgi:hypothetical protein